MNLTIRRQKRQSMVFQVTPRGAVVLIPQHMDPKGRKVQAFIRNSLARLPHPEPVPEPLSPEQVQKLVADWSGRLGVRVVRTQIRTMRHKWGSISTAGTLTLAADILHLPLDLAEYVVVHELLHLKFPDHGQGWQVSMGMHLPNWREREKRLQRFVLQDDTKGSRLFHSSRP